MSNAAHSAPATGAVAVTPSDTTTLLPVSRSLWVGGAGDIVALMQDSSVATFYGVPAGSILPFRVRRINETGTSATSIVALY